MIDVVDDPNSISLLKLVVVRYLKMKKGKHKKAVLNRGFICDGLDLVLVQLAILMMDFLKREFESGVLHQLKVF